MGLPPGNFSVSEFLPSLTRCFLHAQEKGVCMRICGKESQEVPSQGETLERGLASREKTREKERQTDTMDPPEAFPV